MSKLSDPHNLVGATIAGKYTIEALIDRGGYGLVYRAVHQVLGQPVALKFFTGLAQAQPEQRAMLVEKFTQEARLLMRLSTRSTNVVQARDILEHTTDEGVWMPYLVLEWIEGRSLEWLIYNPESPSRRQPRPLIDAFYLLDGVARALAVAHSCKVAHRDIKPGNFMVLGEDLRPGVIVKVLDFGIAKEMPQNAAMTAGGSTQFTPKYGAPEQFDRVHGATGPWTDVFGFALVVLETARGGPRCFPQKDFVSVARASQDPKVRPTPRTLGIAVSDAVEAVFARALTVSVHDRYQHMAEFWNDLGAALEVRDFVPVSEDAPPGMTTADERPSMSLLGMKQDANVKPTAPELPRAALEMSRALEEAAVSGAGKSSGSRRRDSGLSTGSRRLANLAADAAESQRDAEKFEDEAVETVGGVSKSRLAMSKKAVRPKTGLIAGGVAAAVACAVVVGVVLTSGSDPPPTDAAPPAAATPEPVTTPPVAAARCPAGMAFIPGGKFFMGSDNVDDKALAAARPAHQVEVADFCMDIDEVTVAAYAACSARGDCKRAHREALWPQGSMKEDAWVEARAAYSPLCNEGQPGREQHPVNCVTWEEAGRYCELQGKRLPREAEWEFAARGSDGRVYPWGDDPPDEKHLNGCGSECTAWRASARLPETPRLYDADDGHHGTAPVGSFPAGATQAGLRDMVGNVFEWTADDALPYPGAPEGTKLTPGKIMRGGAFNSFQREHAEPALRFGQDPTAHVHAVGFRCARSDPNGREDKPST
ncbi:MAG: SUMF1/EgtB/PvdO family nonheme iron enzyme [Myxococcales bacterium]|nr:SUMF1/EgtB/PvdO family nonheme iron enzyme [Myxococcales bacterium]